MALAIWRSGRVIVFKRGWPSQLAPFAEIENLSSQSMKWIAIVIDS